MANNTFPDSGNVGIGTTSPTQALDMGGRSKNIKFDYAHIGETDGGAATIIANKARVNQTEKNRVDYSHSNQDGVSAIELLYTNGISFFTKPIDTANPTVEGDQFFSLRIGHMSVCGYLPRVTSELGYLIHSGPCTSRVVYV